MPNPYCHWDVSLNHQLNVSSADGPLIIDEDTDVALWNAMISIQTETVLSGDQTVGFVQYLQNVVGSFPNNGIKISSYQYMPAGLLFNNSNPVDGEPLPHNLSDPYGPIALQAPYTSIGFRYALRGWVSTSESNNLQCEIAMSFKDSKGLRIAGSSDGGYTGQSLLLYNIVDETADYIFSVLHGKRPTTDTNWSNHGVVVSPSGSVQAGTPIIRNNVDSDKFRIVCTGDEPSWSIQMDQDTIGDDTWNTLFNASENLVSELSAPNKKYACMVAELFSGNALKRDWVEPVPTSETLFNYIRVSQFEPWVIDKSSWSYSDWADYFFWLTGSITQYSLERRLPAKDLKHIPMGVDGCPTTLRSSDSELGICVEFNEKTYLKADPSWDLSGTYNPNDLVHVAVCDEGSFGKQAPITFVGKFKFANMSGWSIPIDIMGAGDWWSASTGTVTGIGIYWNPSGNPGEGNLIARAFDEDSSSWKEASVKFNSDDYEDEIVEVALIWTGTRGSDIGEDDNQLILAVNSIFRSKVEVVDFKLVGSEFFIIGSKYGLAGGSSKSFSGLFREAVVFGEALSQEALRSAFVVSSDGVINDSFEIAGNGNRPGEAYGWTWESYQSSGEWAGYNSYHERLRFCQTDIENFSGGFFFPHDYQFEDESERISATGFSIDDVGKVAFQKLDESMWRLTGVSPNTWDEIKIGSNEDWADSIEELLIQSVLFNAGLGLYEGTQENFNIWGGNTSFTPWWPVRSKPWVDSYDFISPATEITPTGFNGYMFDEYGDYPLGIEQFGEGWGSDPFIGGFNAHCGVDGRLYGNEIDFPVTISPNKNEFVVYTKESTDDAKLTYVLLSPGVYDDAQSLSVMLQSSWVSAGGDSNVKFSYHGDSGITFGQQTGVPNTFGYAVAFCQIKRRKENDVREDIGFAPLSASTTVAKVIFIAEKFGIGELPSGIEPDDEILIDSWSFFSFKTDSDPNITGSFFSDSFFQFAIFNSLTRFELFDLEGWFGSGAEWKDAFVTGDLLPAYFDGYYYERFTDTDWPDEPFTQTGV